jgi:hypothetical protein
MQKSLMVFNYITFRWKLLSTGSLGNIAPNLSYINFQGVSVAEKALNGGINNPNFPTTNPGG